MCVYIYMYIYICIYIHVYIDIYIYTHIYISSLLLTLSALNCDVACAACSRKEKKRVNPWLTLTLLAVDLKRKGGKVTGLTQGDRVKVALCA